MAQLGFFGILRDFLNIYSVAKQENMKGDHLETLKK